MDIQASFFGSDKPKDGLYAWIKHRAPRDCAMVRLVSTGADIIQEVKTMVLNQKSGL